MRKRNLLLTAGAMALATFCAPQASFASQAVTAMEAVAPTAAITKTMITSLKEITPGANPTQHVVFLDGNGAILADTKPRHARQVKSAETLEAILALQNAGVMVYAITAHGPKNAVEEYQTLLAQGLDFTKSPSVEGFNIYGRSFYKGVFCSPRMVLSPGDKDYRQDRKKTVTKPSTMKFAVDLLRNQGVTVSQISFAGTGTYNFKTAENQGFDVPVNLCYFEGESE